MDDAESSESIGLMREDLLSARGGPSCRESGGCAGGHGWPRRGGLEWWQSIAGMLSGAGNSGFEEHERLCLLSVQTGRRLFRTEPRLRFESVCTVRLMTLDTEESFGLVESQQL